MIDTSREALVKLARAKIHFGKYKGRYLSDLPEEYILWFIQQGLPEGELGEMLLQMKEIKTNGLEYLLRNIRQMGIKCK